MSDFPAVSPKKSDTVTALRVKESERSGGSKAED